MITLIFGGTFDPPHRAHLFLAQAAQHELSASKVSFMPSVRPAHRQTASSPKARTDMLKLAIADTTNFDVEMMEWELANEGLSSYTTISLKRIRARTPPSIDLCLLIGQDCWEQIQTWYHYRDLLKSAHLAIAPRSQSGPVDHEYLKGLTPPEWQPFIVERLPHERTSTAWRGSIIFLTQLPLLAISATAIRTQIKAGSYPKDLLQPSVLSYIRKHQLYQ
ncbi:MAG: nicotinate (nicotinamide) nucleotide adenylyltransferase [Gammaproteobacteria bacterium]